MEMLQISTIGVQRQDEFWEFKRILEKLDTWLEYVKKKLCGSPDQMWLRNSLRLLYSLPIICSEARIIEEMLMNQCNQEDTTDKLDALASIAFELLSQEKTLKRKQGSSEQTLKTIEKKRSIMDEFPSKSSDATKVETRRNSPVMDTQRKILPNPPLLSATPPIQHYDNLYHDTSYYGYYQSRPYEGYYDSTMYQPKPYERDMKGYDSQYQSKSYTNIAYSQQQRVTSPNDTTHYVDPHMKPDVYDRNPYYPYDNRTLEAYPSYDAAHYPYYAHHWPQ